MPAFDSVFQGDPNAAIENSFPVTSGSVDNPLLLFWTYRRILYLNIGGDPLWSALAQIGPDQVIQKLEQPLLGNVIAKLQAEPVSTGFDVRFARMLERGF